MHDFSNWPMAYLPTAHNGNFNFQTGTDTKYCMSPSNNYLHLQSGDSEDNKDCVKKNVRDPISHRIIEKKRRDRMNNCLADLSRLIPKVYLKKGRGRIEKTEIIEMAIKHVKHLEAHCKMSCNDVNQCYLMKNVPTNAPMNGVNGNRINNNDDDPMSGDVESKITAQYMQGFREASTETLKFLSNTKHVLPMDELCHSLAAHLESFLAKQSMANDVMTPVVTNNSLLNISGANSSGDEEIEVSRNRSASISSILSISTTRSGSTPTPPKFESNENLHGTVKNSTETSQLRDILQHEQYVDDDCGKLKRSDSYRPFKKEIKKRFQSDMATMVDSRTSVDVSRSLKKEENNENISTENFELKAAPLIDEKMIVRYKNRIISSVPAFALHPSGAFYIPLAINASYIAQWLLMGDACDFYPVIHPVNISVNFACLPSNRRDSFDACSSIDLTLTSTAAAPLSSSPPPQVAKDTLPLSGSIGKPKRTQSILVNT